MSPRAVVIGLVGVTAICWIVSLAELLYLKSGYLQIPPAALVMLAILLGFQRVAGRWRLSRAEVAILYGMFLVAALVASRGSMEKLVPALISPHYLDSPAKSWASKFFQHLPDWAYTFDPRGPATQQVSKAYFEGLQPGEAVPWALWIPPLLAWAILVALMYGAFLCLAALLRRPWVDQERLAFPLTRVPLEMMGAVGGRSLWRQPLLWAGFLVPTVVYSLNSLHAWYPTLPGFAIQYPGLETYFTQPPWNGLYGMPVFVSFAAIGALWFVPLDLLFSLWFFFLFARLQEGVLAMYGFDRPDMPMMPCRLFVGYQTIGAYIVLAIGLLRGAWPWWRAALRGVVSPGDLAREPIPPRVALAGLGLCLLGATLWSHALGLSLWWALVQWTLYLLVVCVVLARSVAEGGMLATEVSFRPVDVYALLAPPHFLGTANLVGMPLHDAVWFRDQRGTLFTGILDSLKLAGGQGVRLRSLTGWLVVALALATVVAAVAQVWLPYRFGALKFYDYIVRGNPVWGYDFYAPHLQSQRPYDWQAPVFFGVGAGVTLALVRLRALFAGWPLLPLGYALCGSWTLILFWFSAFVTWMAKGLVLRYGSRDAFHRFRPFFIGLLLGEFAMFVLWTLAAALLGVSPPAFPWP
jgi:hypothetical protein